MEVESRTSQQKLRSTRALGNGRKNAIGVQRPGQVHEGLGGEVELQIEAIIEVAPIAKAPEVSARLSIRTLMLLSVTLDVCMSVAEAVTENPPPDAVADFVPGPVKLKLSESTGRQPKKTGVQMSALPEPLIVCELEMGTTSARQDVIASAEKANIFKHFPHITDIPGR